MTISDSVVSSLSSWTWQINVQAAMIVIVAALVSCLPRSILTTRWRSMLWTMVFVRLALPFTIPFAGSLQNLFFSAPSQPVVAFSTDTGTLSVPMVSPTTADENSEVAETGAAKLTDRPARLDATRISWSVFAMTVWWTVALLLLLRLARWQSSLRRLLARQQQLRAPAVIALAQRCATEAGLKKLPRLLLAPVGSGPAVSGWRDPTLLLPQDCIDTLTESQLRLVLLHEFRHIKSGDTLVAWIQQVLSSVYWFNPFAWIALHRWRGEREMACDWWVLSVAGRDNHRTYAQTLLTIVESTAVPQPLLLTAGIVHFPSLLERRIRTMRKANSPTLFTAAIGAILLLSLAFTGLTDHAEATEKQPAKTQEKDRSAKAPTDPATEPETKKQPAPRRPSIVFAKHVVLWDSSEVMSMQEFGKRLTEWRKTGPVLPRIYMTNGHVMRNRKIDQNAAKKILSIVGDQEFTILSFVQGPRNEEFDAIKTQADVGPIFANAKRGTIRLPSGAPAAGTQVVTIPHGRVQNLNVNQQTWADPVNEQCVTAATAGDFTVHPAAGAYSVAMFHSDGYLIVPGPLSDGAAYSLLPWQTTTFTTDDWPKDQQAEIWVQPDGTAGTLPGFSMKWISRSNQNVTLKMPLGKGLATQVYSPDGSSGAATGVSTRFVVAKGSPTTIVLPPLTEEQRAAAKKKFESSVELRTK